MKHALVLVLTISGLLGWLTLPAWAEREDADLHFKSGTQLLKTKDTAQAQKLFRKALKAYPTHTDSAVALGRILARAKDPARLTKFYTNWLEASKNNIEAAPKQINLTDRITKNPARLNELNQLNKRYSIQHVSLANSLKDKEPTMAVKACEKALQLNPANAAAANLLARLTLPDDTTDPADKTEPLPRDLVGYWKLDRTSGTVAKDSSGRKNHGVIHRAKRVTGQTGQALQFNGRSSYVLINEPGPFNTFSVSFWMQNPSATGVLFNRDRIDKDNAWWIKMNDHALEFGVGLEKITHSIIANRKINDSTWHHVICTRDNSTGNLAIYIDGKLDVFAAERTGEVSAAPTITIGRWNQRSAGFWAGKLDEVKIYNRVLGTEEIRVNYKNQ